jgi:hypothetical protein
MGSYDDPLPHRQLDSRQGPREWLLVDMWMEQHSLRDHLAVDQELPPVGVCLPPLVIRLDRDVDAGGSVGRHRRRYPHHVGAPVVTGPGGTAAGRQQRDRRAGDCTAYPSNMTEFTIHLPNRPGSLADLAERLAEAAINIEALAAQSLGIESAVRLIVDDEGATRRLLESADLRFEERRVLTTTLPNRPGSVAAMTRQLAEAGANIDAMYLLRTTVEGMEFAIAIDEDADRLAS